MCFTFFFVLSVSKARSIFILKLEGYSHWSMFFPAGYTYLPAWVFRSLPSAPDLIYTVWHLATPFLVFFSFQDSTVNGHVAQISDFLRYRKIKATDFSEVAKFWKVLINFHKVMTIIRFYAN